MKQDKGAAFDFGNDFKADFPGQFILSRPRRVHAPGWTAQRGDRWCLWRNHAERTCRIVDLHGTPIGWFLGIGVDCDGVLITDLLRLPYDSQNGQGLRASETRIEQIAGRWLVILDAPDLHRIYCDPVGDFSCLYNARDQLVAPSTLLCLGRPMEWNGAFERDRILAGTMHFSLQQAADPALRRMVPNHYLDLDQFTCVRHWPRTRTPLLAPQISVEDNMTQIDQRLKQVVSAICRGLPVTFPISGGRDSRNLLCAAGADAAHIMTSFSMSFHKMSRHDAEIGQAVAARLNVPHRVIPYSATTPQQLQDYQRRTGFMDGGSGAHLVGTQMALPAGHVQLRGNVMELLRANQWVGKVSTGAAIYPNYGLKRLLIDTQCSVSDLVERWRKPYMAWIGSLPAAHRARHLDFGFLEHLLPNTLGARHFGVTNSFIMNPFADRRLIQLAIQIPPEIRMTDQPNQILLASNAARLADIPFDRSYYMSETKSLAAA